MEVAQRSAVDPQMLKFHSWPSVSADVEPVDTEGWLYSRSSLEPAVLLWIVGMELLIKVDFAWLHVDTYAIIQGIFNPCDKF